MGLATRVTGAAVLIFEPRVMSKAIDVRDAIYSSVQSGRIGIITEKEPIAAIFSMPAPRRRLKVHVIKVSDLGNATALWKQVQPLGPWKAMLVPHEYAMESAARFAAVSGLNFHPYSTVLISRYKPAFRRFIQKGFKSDAVIKSHWSGLVSIKPIESLPNRIRAIAPRRSTELIIKPTDAGGSWGVRPFPVSRGAARIARRAVEDFCDALNRLKNAQVDCDGENILVESRLGGEEFSLECCRDSRGVHTYAVHWKVDIDSPSAPFLERLMVSLPREIPPAQLLCKCIERLSRSMGAGLGPLHPEFRVDIDRQHVYPIEIALRPGGGVNNSCVESMHTFGVYDAALMAFNSGRSPLPTPRPPIIACGEVMPIRTGELKPLQLRTFDDVFRARDSAFRALPDNKIHLRLNAMLSQVSRREVQQQCLRPLLHRKQKNALVRSVWQAFDPSGHGLRATAVPLRRFTKTGTIIHAREAAFVAGLNVVANPGLDPYAAVAEAIATLDLCLNAIRCDAQQ